MKTDEVESAALTTCVWELAGYLEWEVWSSACGHEWTFEEGTPYENGMKFCPFCGHPLEQRIPEPEEDDE
jgi:hypothetical protein